MLCREMRQTVFPTKIFLDILTHPLIEPYANAIDLVYIISKTTSLYCKSSRDFIRKEMNCFNYCFKMSSNSIAVLEIVSSNFVENKIQFKYTKIKRENHKRLCVFDFSKS
jgi:hypothetical protein